jgi:hypothetical protein
MVLACRRGGGGFASSSDMSESAAGAAAAADFHPKNEAIRPGDLGWSVDATGVSVSVDLDASPVTPMCIGCNAVAVLVAVVLDEAMGLADGGNGKECVMGTAGIGVGGPEGYG